MRLLECRAVDTRGPLGQSNVGHRALRPRRMEPRFTLDLHFRSRLVMGMAEPWRGERLGGCLWEVRSIGLGCDQWHQVGQYLGNHLPGDGTRAKNCGTISSQIDDGAFDSMAAAFLAHDGIDFSIQILQHGLPGGGAGSAGAIGTGGSDGQTSMLQQLPSDWVGGDPDPDRRESSSHAIGDPIGFGKHQRHRAGAEFLPEFDCGSGDASRQLMYLVHRCYMHDQWVVAGSSFGLKDLVDCRRIERIGSQTEDRFSRERDGATLRPNLGNAIEIGGCESKRWTVHRVVGG